MNSGISVGSPRQPDPVHRAGEPSVPFSNQSSIEFRATSGDLYTLSLAEPDSTSAVVLEVIQQGQVLIAPDQTQNRSSSDPDGSVNTGQASAHEPDEPFVHLHGTLRRTENDPRLAVLGTLIGRAPKFLSEKKALSAVTQLSAALELSPGAVRELLGSHSSIRKLWRVLCGGPCGTHAVLEAARAVARVAAGEIAQESRAALMCLAQDLVITALEDVPPQRLLQKLSEAASELSLDGSVVAKVRADAAHWPDVLMALPGSRGIRLAWSVMRLLVSRGAVADNYLPQMVQIYKDAALGIAPEVAREVLLFMRSLQGGSELIVSVRECESIPPHALEPPDAQQYKGLQGILADNFDPLAIVPEQTKGLQMVELIALAVSRADGGPLSAQTSLGLLFRAVDEAPSAVVWETHRREASRALAVVLRRLQAFGFTAQHGDAYLATCEYLVQRLRCTDVLAAAVLQRGLRVSDVLACVWALATRRQHLATSEVIHFVGDHSRTALEDMLRVLDGLECGEGVTLACLERIRHSFSASPVIQAARAAARLGPEHSRELLAWIGQRILEAVLHRGNADQAGEMAGLYAALLIRTCTQCAQSDANGVLADSVRQLKAAAAKADNATKFQVGRVLQLLELFTRINSLQLQQNRGQPDTELYNLSVELDAEGILLGSSALALVYQQVVGSWVAAVVKCPLAKPSGAMPELWFLGAVVVDDDLSRQCQPHTWPLQFAFKTWKQALGPVLQANLPGFCEHTLPQTLYIASLEKPQALAVSVFGDLVADFVIEAPNPALHIAQILAMAPQLNPNQKALWTRFHAHLMCRLMVACVEQGDMHIAESLAKSAVRVCMREFGKLDAAVFDTAVQALSRPRWQQNSDVAGLITLLGARQ